MKGLKLVFVKLDHKKLHILVDVILGSGLIDV